MFKSFTRAALAGAIALGAASGAASTASAADVTLRFAHFWPAVAGLPTNLFDVWAKKVEEDSNGRIAIEMYPSATLAKPPAQYDAVKNRVADITATVLGYTANRFPLTQVVEVPGVSKNGVNGSCVLESLYEEGKLGDEYKETHPLFFFTHGPGNLHTKDKLIQTPEDLKGLRIRRPTTLLGSVLENLGAQPVGMPAPESYQSMQRGVIDGVALPWEGMISFRLNELATMHTETGGLYTISFVMTMNKDVYDGLPDDLKKVIDDNSGLEWAKKAGQVFDDIDVKGRAQAVKAGHQIYVVPGGMDNPDWKPVKEAAVESYLAELDGKNLPGRDVYARALELSKSCQ
jgi:TRAP-type C4-dicarboxylate transport system substrate-binding protein